MADLKNKTVARFISNENGALMPFRSILLFGRNTSTYKFALAKALLHLNPEKSHVKFDDILPLFVEEFMRHIRPDRRQANSKRPGAFERTCLAVGDDPTKRAEVNDIAGQVFPRYVLDAFHNLGGGSLNAQSKLFDHDKSAKAIILRDSLLSILGDPHICQTLTCETESRWEIIEEAWKTGIAIKMVSYNPGNEKLEFARDEQRISLRSAVDALLPYQLGKCFYCQRSISRLVDRASDEFPDVDHFLPHSRLTQLLTPPSVNMKPVNVNGLWNRWSPAHVAIADRGESSIRYHTTISSKR
jgi:hypothetical protein